MSRDFKLRLELLEKIKNIKLKQKAFNSPVKLSYMLDKILA